MPFDKQHIGSLSKKCDELGAILQRNWLLQAVVGGVGLLYIFYPSLAKDLSENFNIPSKLIPIGLPLVALFLFSSFGYYFATYYITRRILLDHIKQESPQDQLILKLSTINYTLFWWVSAMLNSDERLGTNQFAELFGSQLSGRLSGLGKAVVRPAVIMVVGTPAVFVIVFSALGVYSLGNGLSIYFTYTLTEALSPLVRWLIALAGVGGLFALFYAHFTFAMFVIVGQAIVLVWLIFGIALAIAVVLLLIDPLPSLS